MTPNLLICLVWMLTALYHYWIGSKDMVVMPIVLSAMFLAGHLIELGLKRKIDVEKENLIRFANRGKKENDDYYN